MNATYNFTLPFKLESLNTFATYYGGFKLTKFKKRIAEHLFPQVINYKIKGLPFEKVAIKVRCYRKTLIRDLNDNFPASLKPLLDALQPPEIVKRSKKYPDGIKGGYRLGVIKNDDPECIIEPVDYEQIKSKDERTEIEITVRERTQDKKYLEYIKIK